MYCECKPWLIGFQLAPPSSERNAPAAEMATYIRFAFFGSSSTVWRHIPPAPGCHLGPVPWPRNPASSCHVLPPSLVRNRAASSTPAYTVSGSVSDGSRCHTREVGTAHVPLPALAVPGQDARTLAGTHQHSYAAHVSLLFMTCPVIDGRQIYRLPGTLALVGLPVSTSFSSRTR